MNFRSLIKDVRVYRTLAAKGLGGQSLKAVVLNDPQHIGHAQRLHADVYLKRGFVQPGEIGPDGRLTIFADPHQEHAEYFVILNNDDPSDVRAVSRQIRLHSAKGHKSFPMIEQAHIYRRYLKSILGYDPATCVEISALAKRSGESPALPLALYRAMLHRSVEKGDKIWLMAADVRLYQRLKLLFGPAISQIGKVTPYYGGDVVPAMLKIDETLTALIAGMNDKVPLRRSIRKSLPRFFLAGFPVQHISADQYEELVRLKFFGRRDSEG